MKSNPLAWEEDFPPVYGHTSVSYLKHCSGFREAKFGDMDAAFDVAKKCVNRHTLIEIKQKYPDTTLLPVITENKLPMALAMITGMKTHTKVYAHETKSRKSLSAMERLLHKPLFGGEITEGKCYIIVDDIITQGGTVSALRKYVIKNGGTVAAIVTLAYSAGSKILAPNEQDVISLVNKYSLGTITDTLKHYDIAYDLRELTRSQIKYLLLFSELDRLIEKIEKTRTGAKPRCAAFSRQ